MQTFLPYPDFTKSVQCLDNKRLGKQRVEAYQILQTLLDGSAWENHPAVLMWAGFEYTLNLYLMTCIHEWKQRGFENTIVPPTLDSRHYTTFYPPWFNEPAFHLSHKANLMRKDGNYYWDKFPNPHWIDADLPYLWPQTKDHKEYRSKVFYILGQGKANAHLWVNRQKEYGIKIMVP